MNDFVHFLVWKLERAAFPAICAAAVCVLLTQAASRLRGKKISWRRSLALAVFTGYLSVLIYATLFRNEAGFQQINLHLFRAWREAWNSFSLRNWLNVLLNVALFVPLGCALPLLFKPFRRWYWTILVGTTLSLTIELLQAVFGFGLADVDDLFANTLGTVLGCFTVMGLDRKKRYCLLVPAAFCTALASVFVIYGIQEYGNMPLAAPYRVNTGGYTWQLQCELRPEPIQAQTYRAQTLDRRSADSFAEDFFAGIGAECHDVTYYEDCAYYANRNPGHFLFVDYLDGGFTYTNSSCSGDCWKEYGELEVRNAMDRYGVTLPENAIFSYEGEGWHSFRLEQTANTNGMYDGSLRCRMDDQGQVAQIDQFLQYYEKHKTVAVLSEKDAYRQLQRGWFAQSYELSGRSAPVVQIHGVELAYRIDTNGFYCPVYIFDASVDGVKLTNGLLIPAMP